MPKFNILERYKLKHQAENLASDLRYTQKLAMSENSNYYFRILKKDKGYLIEKIGDSTNNKLIYMPNDIGFAQESKNNIKYTSKGTPANSDDGTEGAGGTIYLVSNNYKIEVTVRPVTGRVTVYNITKKLINGDV